MPKSRKISLESLNFQTNLDTRTLADAAMVFVQRNNIAALKTISGLIRSIVEEWVNEHGGRKVKTLDDALAILQRLGLTPNRTGEITRRGRYEMTTQDAAEHTEMLEDIRTNNERIMNKQTEEQRKIADAAAKAIAFLNRATDEDLRKD